jgi:hypothetical protein
MFGRLDEDPSFEREYMIVSNFVDEDPIVFYILCTPDDAREMITAEIETHRGVSFAIYELVENANVLADREIEFTEDWATEEVLDWARNKESEEEESEK